jgi:hypothetical protein
MPDFAQLAYWPGMNESLSARAVFALYCLESFVREEAHKGAQICILKNIVVEKTVIKQGEYL